MSVSAKSRKRKEIEQAARYLAATSGGEIDDWIEGLTPHGKPFTDEFLIQRGYKHVATHTYTDPNGVVLFQVLRYHHQLVAKEKQLLIRRPGAFNDQRRTEPKYVSEWVFGQPFKVIYRWHEVVRRPGEPVDYCEGEADADKMAELGFVATTVAGQNWSENAADALKGRDVRIWEHNDQIGRENTEAAIELLSPVAKSIKVIRLPGLAHRGDIRDWLDAGHTKEDLIAEAEATPDTGIRLLRSSDLPSEPRPRAWAIPNRVPSRNVTLLSGPGGGGKSTIMLQQCVANTLGREHLGVVPTRGKTLFMDAEEDMDEIHHRLHTICGGLFDNVDYRTLINSGELNICSLVELGATMAAPTRSGRIEPTALYGKFLEMCGDIRPVLTVVANSANVFAGNENDRSQVQQFVDLLRRGAINSGGGLILISHPSLTGIATKSGLSGSTQWHNAVRSRMVLSGVERDDHDGREPTNDMRVITFHKNNYGPLSDQIVLRWQNGVFVPVINTTADQADRHQQAEEKYMEVLHLLTGQGQDLSANKKAGKDYAAAKIYKHPKCKEFIEAEMDAAQQRLLDANKIHILEEGPPTKRRKRILPGPKPEEAM